MTSQGVSALDEHAHIEQFGGTRSYTQLRSAIRAAYCQRYGVSASMPNGAPLNPGNGWVSRLCFEPRVGVQVLRAMLAEHIRSGQLTVLLEHTPLAAEVRGDRVVSVSLRAARGAPVQIEAQYFLDATELGDWLPLTGTEAPSAAQKPAANHRRAACPGGQRAPPAGAELHLHLRGGILPG